MAAAAHALCPKCLKDALTVTKCKYDRCGNKLCTFRHAPDQFCWHFSQNTCTRGRTCKLSHELPPCQHHAPAAAPAPPAGVAISGDEVVDIQGMRCAFDCLTQDYSELKEENAALQQDNDELRTVNDELSSENDTLRNEKDFLLHRLSIMMRFIVERTPWMTESDLHAQFQKMQLEECAANAPKEQPEEES